MITKELKAKLKGNTKLGDIGSLLTYLEDLENDSLERLISEAKDFRFYQSRVQILREIISFLK